MYFKLSWDLSKNGSIVETERFENLELKLDKNHNYFHFEKNC